MSLPPRGRRGKWNSGFVLPLLHKVGGYVGWPSIASKPTTLKHTAMVDHGKLEGFLVSLLVTSGAPTVSGAALFKKALLTVACIAWGARVRKTCRLRRSGRNASSWRNQLWSRQGERCVCVCVLCKQGRRGSRADGELVLISAAPLFYLNAQPRNFKRASMSANATPEPARMQTADMFCWGFWA